MVAAMTFCAGNLPMRIWAGYLDGHGHHLVGKKKREKRTVLSEGIPKIHRGSQPIELVAFQMESFLKSEEVGIV